MQWIGIGLLILAILGIREVRRNRGMRYLPEISDEDFLARFGRSFSAPRDQILGARKRVSEVLGVPEHNLAPEYSYEYLSRRLDFFADFSVAWTDLEYEVREAAADAGTEPLAPETVGHLVAGLIHARPTTPSAG